MKTTIATFVIILATNVRSEEHTSELQSLRHLVCRLLLEKKKTVDLRLHRDVVLHFSQDPHPGRRVAGDGRPGISLVPEDGGGGEARVRGYDSVGQPLRAR